MLHLSDNLFHDGFQCYEIYMDVCALFIKSREILTQKEQKMKCPNISHIAVMMN